MKQPRRLCLVLLLGTLGAAPPPSSMKEVAEKLEGLQGRHAALAKRMDAVILELRDIKAAFPSSGDPEGLLLRKRALLAEAEALGHEENAVRKAHRKGLTAAYFYESRGLIAEITKDRWRAPPVGGKIYVYEKAGDEMKAVSTQFHADLKRERARFQSLEQDYAGRKESSRVSRVAAAALLGVAALVLGGVLLARPREMAPPAPTPAVLPPPAVTGFEPRGLIGRGTLGDVHEVFDPAHGRRLALRVLRPELAGDPAAMERLLAEARAVKALSHPNIAALQAITHAGAQACLAYELAAGQTLQILLRERGRFDWPLSLFVLRRAAKALRHAHRHGIIHRDLKPANIMLAPDGTVKVLDFSLLRDDRGTPPYAAPELEQGTVTAAADLYALSVIFYEMLAGELPFKGPNFPAQKREALYTPPSALVAGLPGGLDAFFKVALAPQPSRRFATAEAMAAAAKALA